MKKRNNNANLANANGWFSVGICKYKPGYKSHDKFQLKTTMVKLYFGLNARPDIQIQTQL